MAKAIFLCSRYKPLDISFEKRLLEICHALVPDNLTPQPKHYVCVKGNTAFAVMNHNSHVKYTDRSLLLGFLFAQRDHWDEPLSEPPDGSYAIFRDSEDVLEVLTDSVASRTIWFYLDDEIFIASTSQRAIVMFLGSFDFERGVIPWVLSTGSHGPNFSWDSRIHRLAPDAVLLLDKRTWIISTIEQPVRFSEVERSVEAHLQLLSDAIDQTIRSLKELDFTTWALPLSGGYDSRAILCYLINNGVSPRSLRTVTWGLEASISDEDNDAFVAKALAARMGTQHSYYYTDITSESLEQVIDRFLSCGEGRIDHLSGYMDGFELWRKLVEDGITGIIRGDEGFGWYPSTSAEEVRFGVGCTFCSDYANLKHIAKISGLPKQELPSSMERSESESLAQWRDRLYQTYRIPIILAALSDLKYPFVEQITPLLSKAILNRIRELPDSLRTDKYLFRQIVQMIGPDLTFASRGANAAPQDILKEPDFVKLIERKLHSDLALSLLGDELVRQVLSGISTKDYSLRPASNDLITKIKRRLPQSLKRLLRKNFLTQRPQPSDQPFLDSHLLAFRAFILLRMYEILEEDSHRILDR